MNKSELIEHIASSMNMTKSAVDGVLAILAVSIAEELNDGGEVTIPGIGKFYAINRPARPGRNPKTGEPVTIQPSVAPKFKAAKALKDALN